MTTIRDKRRIRRVASDEAHSWARSLVLNNPNAKSVLRALSLYVDGEACCFVGLEALAADTDLSGDTVRRRIVWLEEIGAISRQAQWLDANGKRNTDGRGKRTTDLIRLLLDADADEIEARAAGAAESDAKSKSISPSSQQGLNSGQPSVSPRSALAVVQGPDSLNHEPESPPKPPPGAGEGEAVSDLEDTEPTDFATAWQAYPGREVMRRDLALAEFRLLAPADQQLCRDAVPLFAAALVKNGRTKPPGMHLWIRVGGFREFGPEFVRRAAADDARNSARQIADDELAGLTVAIRIAEQRDIPASSTFRTKNPEVQKDLAALAQWRDDRKREGWFDAAIGTPHFAAWRDRLRAWTGIEPRPETIWREPICDAHSLPSTHPDFRLRKSIQGFRVPRMWPPKRDGSWSENGEAA